MDDATLLRRLAVEVMGWGYWSPNGHPSNVALYDSQKNLQQPLRMDWESASRVVEKMREKGFRIWIDCAPDDAITHNPFMVNVTDGMGMFPYAKESADTMPRAVMLAALKAVEATQKPAGLLPVYPGPDLKAGDIVYLEDGTKAEVYGVTEDSGVRTSLGHVCATKLYREAAEVKP